MSDRLNQEREKRLQPKRMQSCKKKLESMGFDVEEFGGNRLEFEYKGEKIRHYPYSGWHTGGGINDGRGFSKLIKQIEE